MAKVISILNRKGGVGKTTLSIALAETIVWERSEHVLLIDLDPQASASEALMSPSAYEQVREAGRTLPCHLRRRLNGEKVPASQIVFAMTHALEHRHSVRLDLVPNDERLWDLEWDLATGERKRFERVVRAYLEDVAVAYEWVIIDCPPGRIAAQQAAMSLSNLVLCPVIPERLSEWGMQKLSRELNQSETRWNFVLNVVLNEWDGRYDLSTQKWSGSIEHRVFLERAVSPSDTAAASMDQHFIGFRPLAGVEERRNLMLYNAIPDREVFKKRMARLRESPRPKVRLDQIYEDGADVLRNLLGHIIERISP